MSATSRIFAVVPAAGKSVRMGATKLALPLAGRTILEHVITALRQAAMDDVLVVLGPHVAELAASATAAGAQAFVLDHDTAHMRETVERGLAWLEEHRGPRPNDWLLLVPADHPMLQLADVMRTSFDVARRSATAPPTTMATHRSLETPDVGRPVRVGDLLQLPRAGEGVLHLVLPREGEGPIRVLDELIVNAGRRRVRPRR